MKRSRLFLENQLLSSLIGLVHISDSMGHDEKSDLLIFSSLKLIQNPSSSIDEILEMDKTIKENQHDISPACLSCASPCGNGEGISVIDLFREESSLKREILSQLCRLSALYDEPDRKLLDYQRFALFALKEDGEDWYFEKVLSQGDQLIKDFYLK